MKLTNGKTVLLDPEDELKFEGLAWTESGGYASRSRQRKTSYLHRLILNAKSGQYVDHINGDTLDNRRLNLRLSNASQNAANSPPRKGRDVKGVYWLKAERKWAVQFRDGCRKTMKRFFDRELAVEYAKTLHKQLHGEFSRVV